MQLLHVCASLGARGGGLAERTVRLCDALTRRGNECSALTLAIGLDSARRAELSSIRLHVLPCIHERFYVPGVSLGRVRSAVETADVVELVGHWTLLNLLAYRAARAFKKPYIVTPAGALGIIGRSRVLKQLYNRVAGATIIRSANGHVAITTQEIPQFAAYGVPANRLTLIPNGVVMPVPTSHDCEAFRARHRLPDRRFILFMGRLAYIKGPDLILEAFARISERLRGHNLLFVGQDDGMLEQLHRMAGRLRVLDRVHFVGYLGGDDRECAYRCSEFLVLPSRREAMSIVALEAGIRGKPVLTTDQCGLDEIADVGGGRVVPADVEALGEGMLELASDRARLERMGEALCRHVRSIYSWDRAGLTYERLCKDILVGRKS